MEGVPQEPKFDAVTTLCQSDDSATKLFQKDIVSQQCVSLPSWVGVITSMRGLVSLVAALLYPD